MRSRLLLDPAPTDGGGAPPPPGTPPALADALQALLTQFQGQGQTPPAAPPPAPGTTPPAGDAPPNDVYAWLQNLQRSVEEREAADRARTDADAIGKLQKQVESLMGTTGADPGRLREGLQKFQEFFTGKLGEKDKAIQEVQGRYHGTLLNNLVATETAGVKFATPAAAKDALSKLGGRFEVAVGPDGSPVVREKVTGRPAADVIREALAGDDFAHFLAPEHRGQGGVGGGHSASPTGQPPGSGGPRDVVSLVKAGIAAQQAAWQRAGLSTGLPAGAKRPLW